MKKKDRMREKKLFLASSKEVKGVYEQTLKVTAILHRYEDRTQFTLVQAKKTGEPFTLTIHASPELFGMGDVVELKIIKKKAKVKKK